MAPESTEDSDTYTNVYSLWNAAPDDWVGEDYDEVRIREAKIIGEKGSEHVQVELEMVK